MTVQWIDRKCFIIGALLALVFCCPITNVIMIGPYLLSMVSLAYLRGVNIGISHRLNLTLIFIAFPILVALIYITRFQYMLKFGEFIGMVEGPLIFVICSLTLWSALCLTLWGLLFIYLVPPQGYAQFKKLDRGGWVLMILWIAGAVLLVAFFLYAAVAVTAFRQDQGRDPRQF